MKPNCLIIFLLAASTFMVLAESQPETNVVVKAKSKPKAREPQDGPAERGRFGNAVALLWQQGDIVSLEKMGNELWQKDAKFPEGLSKLSIFYLNVDNPIGTGEAGFLAAEKQIKAWEEKYTNSVIAPILEGEILTSHAWFFRGNGYANTITAEGAAKYTEYLAKAAETLEKSKPHCSVCPAWHNAMLKVGLGQGWNSAKFDQVFEDGVKLAPDYYDLYFQRAYSLLPRWYGRKGEWQAFAEKQAEKHGPDIYARIAWAQSGYYDSKTSFTDGEVSWVKMKAGFDKILKDYPDSIWNLNSFCRFACLAGDRETAKELFAKIGRNRHPQCWAQKEFNQYKQWAIRSE